MQARSKRLWAFVLSFALTSSPLTPVAQAFAEDNLVVVEDTETTQGSTEDVVLEGNGIETDGGSGQQAPDPSPTVDDTSGIQATRGVEGDQVAVIGDEGYDSLAAAFAAATAGDTIMLSADSAIDATIELSDARDVALDLAGHTVSSDLATAFKLTDGSLTITNSVAGSGGIAVTGEAFRVMGKNGATPALTIDKDVDITSTEDCCVFIVGTSTLNTAGKLESRGEYCTIQGNGNAENNGTTINITDGLVKGAQEAIYVPQDNTMTVSGGTIEGKTAIYCKSGKLTITGGTLIGTGEKADFVHNGNGCDGTGDALVVENCGYPGGEPTVSVQGGSFKSANAAPIASYATSDYEPKSGFVTGGLFSDRPADDLLDEGFVVVDNTDDTADEYPWTTGESVTVTFDAGDDATEVPSQKIAKGATVTKPADPTKEGFTFEGWFAPGAFEAFDFATAIDDDLTLTAHWTEGAGIYDQIQYRASLSLNECIDINFYVKNLPKDTNPSDYKFVYWLDGDKDNATEVSLYEQKNNRIVVSSLTAQQMPDVVTFQVYHGDKLIKERDYSIRTYCENKIDNAKSIKELVDLCQAALNYGTYAQHYFGAKTDDLANKKYYPDIEDILATTEVPEEHRCVADESTDEYKAQVKKTSLSTSLESQVVLNLYVTPQPGVDPSTISVTCAANDSDYGDIEQIVEGGKICVRVFGIDAKDLDHRFTFDIDANGAKRTIKYSALSYTFSKQNDENTTLATLSKAIYNYWLAAHAYFGGGEEPDTYTVTWKNDDGTVLETDEGVIEGETPTYDGETPTKEGDAQYSYEFVGWDPEVEPVSCDTEYTAIFERVENTCAVTFDSNGAGDVEAQTVTYGRQATEPEAPTRDDGFFLGWYAEGATEPFDFGTAITADLKLTAKWMTLAPATLELYPNDKGTVAVENAVDGYYYYWKFAGDVGSGGFNGTTGEGYPYGKAPGAGTATLTVYTDNSKAERVFDTDLVCNVTVKDVAARVGDTEYATADFAAAVDAAKNTDQVLEVYTTGTKVTLDEGDVLKVKAADNRGKGSVTVSAPAATADHMYAIDKATDSETGITTYTCVDKGTPNVEYTAPDGTKSYSEKLSMSKVGTYKVMNDFSSSRVSVTVTGVTLDLNGHTVSFDTGNTYPAIMIGSTAKTGELTITDSSESGTGAIINSGAYAVWAAYRNSGVTIEGGTIVATTDAVYTSNGSTATITGGTFKVTGADKRYVVNCKDDNKGTITVSGGTFYEFNPADNAADGQHTNYLVEGKAVAVGEDDGVTTYTVCDAVSATFVNEDGTELQKVTLAAGQTPTYTGETPTKDEDETHTYAFSGWQPELGPISEDTTFTAQFASTVKRFTITFVTGEGGTAIDPITQDFESEITAPEDPTREGYVFKGWDQEIPAKMPAHDMTITATWRKVLDLSLSLAGWTYGDTASTPVLTGNEGNAEVTCAYKAQGADDSSYVDGLPEAAGAYTVRATVAETEDFCGGTATADVTVAKRGVTVKADDKSSPYKAALADLTYQLSSGTLVAEGDLATFGIEATTEATTESGVGTYDITLAGGTDNPNYDVTLEKGTYTITRANAYVTASGFSGAYDGQPHAITVEVRDAQGNPFTDLLAALFGTGKEATVYYSTTDELTAENYQEKGSLEAPTRTEVGTTAVHYYVDLANYQADTAGGSEAVSGTQTIEISKAAPEVSAPAPIEGLAYTGSAQTLVTAGTTTGGSMKYYVADEALPAGATIESIGADQFTDELPTGVNQGSYYVYYYVDGGTNYADTELAGPVEASIAAREVAPEELTIELDSTEFTYNGADQRPSVSVAVGDTPLVEGTDYTLAWPEDTKTAGSKDVTVTLQGNYSGSGVASYAIAQKQVALTWKDDALTYTGEAQHVTCELAGTVEGDDVQVALTGDAGTNAGEYNAQASLTGEDAGNYVIPTADATHAWIIAAAQNAIEDLAITGWTYGDDPNEPSATPAFGTVSYSYSDVEDGEYSSNVPMTAGTWWVKATVEGTTNYDAASAVKSFEIDTRAIKVTANDQVIAYGSDIDTSDAAYAVTLASGEGMALVYGDTLTATLSTEDTQVTTDGTIKVTVDSIKNGDADVASNYSVDAVNGKLTITAKDAIPFDEEHAAPAAIEGLTYDGSGQALVTAGNPDGGTVMYRVTQGSDEEQTIVSDWSADIPMQKDAGAYQVSYYVAGNSNYATCGTADEPLGTLSVTIAQKEVGLEWSNTTLTYNGSAQAPSATATGLVEGDACDVTVTGAGTVAGDYTATATALSNDNYCLPAENATDFTIAAKSADSEDIEAKFAEGKGSFVYTGADQAPLPTDVIVTDGDAILVYGTDYTVSADAKKSAGTYELSVSFQGNYAGSKTLEWTIAKATNEITNLALEGWTYGDEPNEPSADAKFGTVSFAYSDGTTTYSQPPKAAGTYTVSATVAGTDDYEAVTESATFTIAKAQLTVTAKAKDITYGDAPANDGVTYGGFVGAEDETVLVGELTYAYDYEQYGDVGSYTITPGGLTSDNYEIAYVGGTLTVSQKTVGIEWDETLLTYTGEAQAPKASATGLVNGNDVQVAVTGAQTEAGSGYTATATGLTGDKAGNYAMPAEGLTKEFSIAQAPAPSVETLTDENKPEKREDSVYSGNEQALLVSPTKLPSDYDGIEYKLGDSDWTSDIPTGLAAGTYSVQYRYVDSTNNHEVFEDESLTLDCKIAQRPVDIDWGDCRLTYTGEEQEITCTADGLREGDDVRVALANNKATDAGEYTATASLEGADADNYKIRGGQATMDWSIEQASNAITGLTLQGWTYGEEPNKPSATATFGGDTMAFAYGDTTDGEFTDAVPTAAGTHFVKATVAETGNYAGAESEPVAFTIEQRPVTVSGITAIGRAYNGETAVGLSFDDAVIAGKMEDDDLSVFATGAMGDAHVGQNKAVTISNLALAGADKDNYVLAAEGQQAEAYVTITPRLLPITAEAGEKTYGDADPDFTYSYSLEDLLEQDRGLLTGSLTRADGEDVGLYDILQGTLTAGSDYAIDFTSAKLTIKTKVIDDATIVLDQASFTYDGTAKEPAVTVKDGEKTIPAGEYSVAYVDNTAAGTATVTVSDNEGGNYQVAGTARFTIEKAAPVLVVAPEANELTYNGNAQELVSAGTATGGTVQYRMGSEGAFGASIPTAANAGGYKVWYKVVGDENHSDLAFDEPVDVAIAKATLTVTAKDHAITYGDAPANAGVTYGGLLGVDAEDVVSGSVTYGYGYSQYGDAGTYTITPDVTGLSADNYAFTAQAGVLTVEPREVSLSWAEDPTYDGTEKAMTATVGGAVNGDEVTVTAYTGNTATVRAEAGYTATATALSSGNYRLPADASHDWNVRRAANEIKSLSIQGWTYGDAPSAPAVTAAFGGDTAAFAYGDAADGAFTDAVPTAAGTHYVKATIAATDNYAGAEYGPVEFSIDPRPVTVSGITASDKEYDGTDGASLQLGAVVIDGKLDNDELGVSAYGSFADKNAAEGKTVTITITGLTGDAAGNYKLAEEGQQATTTATITPKRISVVATDASKTYGDNDPNFDYTCSLQELLADDSWTGFLTRESGDDAGTYAIGLGSLSAGSNYQIDFTGATLTINAKVVDDPTIELSNSDYTYDGEEKKPSVTVKDGETVILESEYDVSYENNVNAGTAKVKITDKANGNYVVSGSTTFTIGKAQASVTTAPEAKDGLVYTGNAQELVTAGVASGGELQYSLAENGTYSASISTAANAGVYKVWYKVVGDENHESTAALGPVDVSIAKATLTVTAKDHAITYGEATANAGVAYGGLLGDDTEAVVSGDVAYGYNYSQYEGVGTYAITPDVTGLSADNYAFTAQAGVLTVEPREVALSWAEDPTYDGTEKAMTATVGGAVNGDEVTVTAYTGNTATVRAEAGYTATATALSSENYRLPADASHDWNVRQAANDIESLSIQGWTYGEEPNEPSATATFGGDTMTFAYGDAADGAFTDAVPTAAGTHYVKATIAATDNYAGAEYGPVEFTIAKRDITFSAVDKSSAYKADLAELEFQLSSGTLASGDDIDDFGVQASTAATATSAVGEYPITLAVGNANDNYSVTLVPGTYTITKANANVTASGYSDIYDGQAHGITVDVQDAQGNVLTAILDALIGTGKEATVYYATEELTEDNYKTVGSEEPVTRTNAGTTTVYYYVDLANYTPSGESASVSGSQTINIEEAPLTVTAKPAAVTYGEAAANDGVSYAGFVNGETESVLEGMLTYDYGNYVAGSDVGSYDITPSGLTSYNYAITYAPGTLIVSKKTVEIAWTGGPFTYNGQAQAPTATATGFLTGEDCTVTVTGAQTNAGDYTATATGLVGEKAANYALPETGLTQTFTIAKADAVVGTEPAAKTGLVYTGQAQGLVTAGVSADGTLQYSDAEAGTYGEAIPTGTNAGTYSVWYKVAGDANHNDSAASGPISVTVAKADLDDLAVAIENWNAGETAKTPSVSNNAGNGGVTYEYKAKGADDSSYATAVPSEVGEYTLRATVAETDNYNGRAVTVDFKINDASALRFTHSDNLAHTDTYLYRVGNGNNVTLGTLFKIDGDGTPTSSDVKIKVNGVETNSSIHTDPLRGIEAGSTANCTYTTNASDWTQSTLKFTGEGPVGVEIWQGSGEHYTLNLEVVTGKNYTAGSTLSSQNSVSAVLLGNVSCGNVNLTRSNLYGNGFTITINSGVATSSRYGILTLTNSCLDNAIVIGPTYTAYSGKYSDNNYAATVACEDNSTVTNCRITGASSPIMVPGKNARVSNTILIGGILGCLQIKDSGYVSIDNVTTISSRSLGIVFYGATTGSRVIIDGALTQHNFVSERETMTNTYANQLKSKMFTNAYAQYHFTSDGIKYANTGIVSLDDGVGEANIIDNRVDKRNYTGQAASFSVLSITVNGYVYSISNVDPSLLETSYIEPNYIPSVQNPYEPEFSWSVPNEDNVAAGGDSHCYKDGSGYLQIQFTVGNSKTINANNYQEFKKYGGTPILPSSVSCVKTSNGMAVEVDNNSITFADAGEYIVTYRYDNVEIYDKDLATVSTVDYEKSIHVNVNVKKNAPNAEITSTSVSENLIWGQNRTSGDIDYYPCAPVLKGMRIVDYDAYGDSYIVLDGNNQASFIDRISSVTVNDMAVTITLANDAELYIKCSGTIDGSVEIKAYNNQLVFCDNKANNNVDGQSLTFVEYTYTGENGVRVSYKNNRKYSNGSATGDLYKNWQTPWKNNKFLKLDAQGGLVSPTFFGGDSATLPTPTKEGFVFLNWNTKADGTGTPRNAGTSMTFSTTTTLYAIWAEAITVQFSSQGTIAETVYGGAGTSSILPSVTQATQWLEGWYTAVEGGSRVGCAGESFTMPDADTVYYAHWRPKCVVSYNANDGVTDIHSETYEGVPLILPTPTNGVKTFEGWFTSAEGGIKIGTGGDSYSPTEGIELFAHWSDNILVTFNGNGGASGTNSDTYDRATPIILPSATWAGHTFNGWYTEASGGTKVGDAGASYAPEAPVTLYAQWTAYVVTYDANGGSVSPTSGSGVVALPTPTRTGYTFNGWYTAASGGTKIGNGGASYTPAADITLHAQWTINSYKVTITTSNSSTAVTVNGTTVNSGGSVAYNSVVKVVLSYSQSNSLTFTIKQGNNNVTYYTNEACTSSTTSTAAGTYYFKMPAGDVTINSSSAAGSSTCIPSGTMVTMADGTKKSVENVTVDDQVLVFNHETGAFDTAGIIFTEADGVDDYRIINLEFSDGSITRLIWEHGYFDLDLMQYVYIREDNYTDFIGHRFCKVTEDGDSRGTEAVTLTNVYVTEEHTGSFSFPSVYHLNFIADDFLSMPGGITGMFNIFEYGDDLKYDEAAKARDIETYGLMSYEDFADYMTYEEYSAYPAPYLGVALGKGIMTPEYLEYLIGRYVADKR